MASNRRSLSNTLNGLIFARLKIFWTYFRESAIRKILRGFNFANERFEKFRVDLISRREEILKQFSLEIFQVFLKFDNFTEQ